jgi:Asp-tRNA(Asn)/Glu-tRNA(Gln) amidotransferase C subunit
MASEKQLSREDFDRIAELQGITGEPAYLDELFAQARGVFMMAETIKGIDVTGVEPEMAFIPPTD